MGITTTCAADVNAGKCSGADLPAARAEATLTTWRVMRLWAARWVTLDRLMSSVGGEIAGQIHSLKPGDVHHAPCVRRVQKTSAAPLWRKPRKDGH